HARSRPTHPVHPCDTVQTSRPNNARWRTRSGKNLPNDVAVDVGEPEVAAGVAVGEPGMVQAHQVEDRRVEVVDVHRVLGRRVAVVVGGAVTETSLCAAAREEASEAAVVMTSS